MKSNPENIKDYFCTLFKSTALPVRWKGLFKKPSKRTRTFLYDSPRQILENQLTETNQQEGPFENDRVARAQKQKMKVGGFARFFQTAVDRYSHL